MSIAERDVRQKADIRGFRVVKLDRVGHRCLLYNGGRIVAEGTLQQISDFMDKVFIDAVCSLSPACKQALVEVFHHARLS